MKPQYDVGVVGYGLCSAVLVNLLLERGLSVIVFDKDPAVLELPRAAHFDDETLRTFQFLGAADDLAEHFTHSRDYGMYNADDQRVWGFAEVEHTPTDQGWLSDYWFFQPHVEHYLRNKALADAGVAKLSCEVVDFEESDKGILISYIDRSGGDRDTPETVAVSYVVGADGASSFVRRHIGTEWEKLAESQRWMIVDIKVHDGVDLNLTHDAWTKVTPQQTVTFCPMPENIQRFEFTLNDDQTLEEVMTPQAIEEFIAQWFKPGEYDVLRADVYHFHSLVAKAWQRGRILLAGDAAHLNPPFLGQGVCAGIRDALNLGWKLARVIKGQSSPQLLETYQSERRPHAFELVRIAGELGDQLAWMAKASPEELAVLKEQVYVHPRPALGAGINPDAAGAGSLSPQPALADGILMDYKVGYNFALVGAEELISGLSADAKAALAALGCIIVSDDSKSVMEALKPLGGKVMLVRPDHYIAGVANSADEMNRIVEQTYASLK